MIYMHSYRLMVKSVSWCCVRGRWLFSNLVTYVNGFEKIQLNSMHNYQYLEITILLLEVLQLRKGNRCLHEVYHDSIAIYNLYIHQLAIE